MAKRAKRPPASKMVSVYKSAERPLRAGDWVVKTMAAAKKIWHLGGIRRDTVLAKTLKPMKPHMVEHYRKGYGVTVYEYQPSFWKRLR